MKRLIEIICFLFCCAVFNTARSQSGLCPPNLDFEAGSFSHWVCKTGDVVSNGGNNIINWSGTGPSSNRHTIIPANNKSVDPYGFFPLSCPNGSGYSVKLGNDQTGAQAEGLFYTYNIPVGISNFSILYQYAVVFEDPGHPAADQPRFIARIFNVTDNAEINCVSFGFTAAASLPGFKTSDKSPIVRYKEWTPVTLNLSGYGGKTISIEFITADCTAFAHFGYAYIDLSSTCGGAVSGANICPGDLAVTLTAPYGLQTYQWYTDNTFSQLLDTAQQIILDPAPPAGTTYPVILIPYLGYGCRDTLYTTIVHAPAPRANFITNKDTQCVTNNLFAFKNTSSVSNGAPMNYLWKFGDGSFSQLRDVEKTFPSIGNYKTKLIATSLQNCKDSIEKVISILPNGKPDFTWDSVCANQPIHFTNLSDETGFTSVNYQWDFNNSMVSGLKNPNAFSYNRGGVYDVRIQMTVAGCENAPQIISRQVKIASPVQGLRYKDITVPEGYSFYITARNAGNEFKWQPQIQLDNYSIKRPLFYANGDVEYLIEITDPHTCVTTDTLQMHVLKKPGTYLPSAFTPNDDGLNDKIVPYVLGMKALKKFTVFNRYGNVVFSTSTFGEGWNGTYKGTKLETGVFVWVLEFIDNNDHLVTQKGTVSLLR